MGLQAACGTDKVEMLNYVYKVFNTILLVIIGRIDMGGLKNGGS